MGIVFGHIVTVIGCLAIYCQQCINISKITPLGSGPLSSKTKDKRISEDRKLPLIYLNGNTWYQVGYNYGQKLKIRINQCFNIYFERFVAFYLCSLKKYPPNSIYDILGDEQEYSDISKNKVISLNQEVTEKTMQFMKYHSLAYMNTLLKYKNIFSNVIDEIKGISDGSKIDLWKIWFINCRGEIFALFFHYLRMKNDGKESQFFRELIEDLGNECTTIIFSEQCILSQNWDWLKQMDNNAVILNIKCQSTNSHILTMTESGLIGKIGFNKHGLGVTINSIVKTRERNDDSLIDGIPIHILMTHILIHYQSYNDMMFKENLLNKIVLNRFIGMGILDKYSNGKYIEFKPKNEKNMCSLNENDNIMYCHTNHLLNLGIEKENPNVSTTVRYQTVEKLWKIYYQNTFEKEKSKPFSNEKAIAFCKMALTDKSDNKLPICRPWFPSNYKFGICGTVTSIVMDLNKLEMYITRCNNDCEKQSSSIVFDTIHLS